MPGGHGDGQPDRRRQVRLRRRLQHVRLRLGRRRLLRVSAAAVAEKFHQQGSDVGSLYITVIIVVSSSSRSAGHGNVDTVGDRGRRRRRRRRRRWQAWPATCASLTSPVRCVACRRRCCCCRVLPFVVVVGSFCFDVLLFVVVFVVFVVPNEWDGLLLACLLQVDLPRRHVVRVPAFDRRAGGVRLPGPVRRGAHVQRVVRTRRHDVSSSSSSSSSLYIIIIIISSSSSLYIIIIIISSSSLYSSSSSNSNNHNNRVLSSRGSCCARSFGRLSFHLLPSCVCSCRQF